MNYLSVIRNDSACQNTTRIIDNIPGNGSIVGSYVRFCLQAQLEQRPWFSHIKQTESFAKNSFYTNVAAASERCTEVEGNVLSILD